MVSRSILPVLCIFLSVGFGLGGSQTPPTKDTSSDILKAPPDTDPQYFPKGIFGDSAYSDRFKNFKARWYSTSLRAMHEPSLSEGAKDPSLVAYRFLWLRSFHHPIAVRLTIRTDGTGTLIGKVTSGAGGYPAGVMTQNDSVEIPKAQVQQFQELLAKVMFWTLPTEGPLGGNDGAQWIMEGVHSGSYHIVDRWSPRKDDYATLCLDLLHLSKIHVEPKDIY